MCVPAFIANSGGVICVTMEYWGKIEAEALDVIEKKVRSNTRQVLKKSMIKNITPRETVLQLTMARIKEAMSL